MTLNSTLRQEIVNFLIELDAFHSENGRKAILLSAGLEKLLPNIELDGKTSEVVPLLVESLAQYGVVPDQQQPALICLLQAVKTQVGVDKQAILQGFCDRFTQQQHIFAACPYRGLSAFREKTYRDCFSRAVNGFSRIYSTIPMSAPPTASSVMTFLPLQSNVESTNMRNKAYEPIEYTSPNE